MANGMALGLKLDNSDSRVYAILGDGELQEGQVWEAVMAAAHYRLDNIVILIDANGLQISRVMNVEPIAAKFAAFGCHVCEVDGHDIAAIISALADAEKIKGQPTAVVPDGKGQRGLFL